MPWNGLRGVALISAVTFMVEIGDVRRFENPRKLMAYLGLVPGECSTGQKENGDYNGHRRELSAFMWDIARRTMPVT